MAASGNSIALKSFQSFAVNEGLLAKVVEAVKAGEKEARTSGDVKSFEVFYKGFRQNIAIGRVFIVPVKVCNNFKDFPIALLYGTVVRELNLGEEVADLIEKKIGETEFDEYSQVDIQTIKDKLFKDAESEEYRSLVLFAPNWTNIREYVVFKFTGDDTKLSNLIRHQIFSAYFNPAVSGAFDALMTTVDTTKLDVTDITPKLTYPFITENPLKAYPDLQKTGGWAKKKLFLTVKTADAITQEVLDPEELSVFEDLDKALTEATFPETTDSEQLGFEGPGSTSGTVEIPEVDADAEIKTGSEGDGTELRHRPDYGEKGSFTQKMNEENAKLSSAVAAKLGARFDRNATTCPDCGQMLDAFKLCPAADAKNGQQFCGKGKHVPDFYVGGGSATGSAPRKDIKYETPAEQRYRAGSDKTAGRFDPNATDCPNCGKGLDGLKMCRDAKNGQQFCNAQPAGSPNLYLGGDFFPKKDIQREAPGAPGKNRLVGSKKTAEVEPAPFETPVTNVGPGTGAHQQADKSIAVKVDSISEKGEAPIGIELDKTGLPVRASKKNKNVDPAIAQQMIDSIRSGDIVTILVHAGGIGNNIEWKEARGRAVMHSSHGGWVLNMGGKHGTPGIADVDNIIAVRKSRRASDEEAAIHVAALLTEDFGHEFDSTSTASKLARKKREDELNKFGSRRKMAEVPLTEEGIWDAITEDFGAAPVVPVPGEEGSSEGSTDSLPEAMTSDKPEKAKAVSDSEVDKAEPKSERPKSKMFGKGEGDKKEEKPEENKEEPKEASSKTAMLFMNEYDIDLAVQALGSDPVLGPAVRFLSEFRHEVDSHSDGWAYWSAPLKAAAGLMTLIQNGMNARREGKTHGITVDDLKRAMAPIKAFMTRRGLAAGMTMPKLAVKKAGEEPFDAKKFDAMKSSPRIRSLSVPEKHQLRIALDTVKNPAKGQFLGGPSVEEAKEIIYKLTGRRIASAKKADAVQSDVAEAKSEIVSPDTVDTDIKQPTESVEEAAKVAANPAAASRKRKEEHPEEFCSKKECLYRTKEKYCPKHTPTKTAGEHKHECPDCGKNLRCNNPKGCPGEGKPATCGAHENPKPEGMKKGSDVNGDIADAKSKVVSPDTVDSDIHQPTESVEEAAKVAAYVTEDDLTSAGNATLGRIERAHPNLLSQYGEDAVLEAVYEVTSHLRNLEEIGSSDVSIWVKQVEQYLSHSKQASEKVASPVRSDEPPADTFEFCPICNIPAEDCVTHFDEEGNARPEFAGEMDAAANKWLEEQRVHDNAFAEGLAEDARLADEWKKGAAEETRHTPETLELAKRVIEANDDIAYDVAVNFGQQFGNVKHMSWFVNAVADEIQGNEDTVREYLDNKEANEIEDVMSDGPDEEYMERHASDKRAFHDWETPAEEWLAENNDKPLHGKLDNSVPEWEDNNFSGEKHVHVQGAAGDENDEEVEMSLGEGDLADLAANLPSISGKSAATTKTALYTDRNFKTKKDLATAVANGRQIRVYSPGPFDANIPTDGVVAVEGPHYPEPHRWYARVTLKDGIIVGVK